MEIIQSPWTLCSQRYDETTNLYRFLNRDYDAFMGRWLTPDPLGFADGPNLYAYVQNNPLMFVDPYGLFASFLYNYAKDVLSSPRFHGACQMVGGAAEMSAGLALSGETGGAAAPLGIAIGTHGADQFMTGLRTTITGNYNYSATSHLLQKTGMSPETANLVDNSFSMGGLAKGAAMSRASAMINPPQFKVPPLKFPKFISYWEPFIDYWGTDIGIYIQILSFVDYVVEIIKSQDEKEIKRIFDFVEFLMCECNEEVQNVMATGFLEALLNHDPDNIQFAKFSKYLGKETVGYLRAWNEFNGTHTEGI